MSTLFDIYTMQVGDITVISDLTVSLTCSDVNDMIQRALSELTLWYGTFTMISIVCHDFDMGQQLMCDLQRINSGLKSPYHAACSDHYDRCVVQFCVYKDQ